MAAESGPSFLAPTSPETPAIAVASAAGCWITDTGGRRYLDWLAGIGVMNVGHGHPAVAEAVRAQLDRHLHVMVYGEYAQAVQEEFARALADLAPVPDARVFLATSGAEAVEGALKLARKRTGRARFVAFDGAYHGGTLGAFSLVGSKALREPFGPLLETAHLPFGDEGALSAIDERVAAVVVEPVQAEGGVRVPPRGFLAAVRRRCDAAGALLILDEIQTGLGRTGAWFAGTAAGVVPDVLVLAKALGGGLPLGAFLARADVMRALASDPPFAHLTTFGGHPLSCAAGLAALRAAREADLPRHAGELGAIALETLRGVKRAGWIADARGAGLLIGVETRTPEEAATAVARCREAGLLVGQALHDERVLRLTPPLVLSDEELVKGLDVLVAALGDAAGRT